MSDKSLDQLIASLKAEAIDAAERESKKILEAAHLQAQKITSEAVRQREQLLQEAGQTAEALLQNGKNALLQAARDVRISLRNDLLHLLEAVLVTEVRREFSPGLVSTAIVKVIENVGTDVTLILSPEFSGELASYIHQRLKATGTTVQISQDGKLACGFAMAHTSQGWRYDISDDEVATALCQHLTNHWINILNDIIYSEKQMAAGK